VSVRIKINRDVVKRGLNYEVYVNHTTYRLNSKRAANDFLRGVDNYLNSQYDLLNINLINVYGAYRRMSSYLDSYDLNAIRQQIKEVENAIELTLTRCSWDNYSSFSFDKLGVSLDILIGILKRMEAVGKQKKYTVLSTEVGSLRNACELQIIAAREFNFTNRKHKANNGKIIEISKKIINFNK
jgi:hypothetical protein